MTAQPLCFRALQHQLRMADINDGKGSLVWSWDNECLSAIATHMSDTRKVPQKSVMPGHWVICEKCELYRDSFHTAAADAVHKENFYQLNQWELQDMSKKDTFYKVPARKSYNVPKVTRCATNKLGSLQNWKKCYQYWAGREAHPSHAQWLLQIKFSQHFLDSFLSIFYHVPEKRKLCIKDFKWTAVRRVGDE